MNAARRKDIANAQLLFDKGMQLLNEAKGALEECKNENTWTICRKGLQGSERGIQAESAIDAMETIIGAIDDLESGCDWGTAES